MAENENEPGVAVPLVWIDLDDAEIHFVNQIIVQPDRNEFILTFGHVSPPLLLGTAEENAARAKTIPYVPVKVVAKMGMTVQRMREFTEVMQRVLTAHDQQAANEKGSDR